MKTNKEYIEEFAQAVQDYYFSKGAIISKDTWDETALMVRQLERRITSNTTSKERLRAFEILHKYAMATNTPKLLDIIEAAQKEILDE